MINRTFILLLIVVNTSSCSFTNQKKDKPKPNVLFISIDDLNDWEGAMGGHPQAITPNLDRLFAKVPLYFKVPGNESNGLKSKQAVSLLDIYPTLVELCGLPEANKLDGESIVPIIEQPETPRSKPVLSNWYYRNHAVRSNDWRYIHYRDGTEELYNHKSDPGEHINLASNSEYANVIAEHKKWLPKNNVLPAGTSEWTGDKLDKRVKEWVAGYSIPEWLR